MPPRFAELYCLSNFSFQRGASHPEELVTQAAAFGYEALAITDECSLAGVVRAHRCIREHSLPLRLIIGSEIRLEDGPALVLLACNRKGYGQLSRLITRGRRAADKGQYRLLRSDLDRGLDGCLAVLLPHGLPDADTEAAANWLAARFPDAAWLAFVQTLDGLDATRLETLRLIGARTGLRLI
ncbi:MAG: PHP domain-containing protein, partial [Azoarcus sp.]|nr:PHP domain-containing protein [Azoarcus sp.]